MHSIGRITLCAQGPGEVRNATRTSWQAEWEGMEVRERERERVAIEGDGIAGEVK